jgi:hypothetical protein
MPARVRPHAAVLGFVLIATLTASLLAQQPKVLAPHKPVAPLLPWTGKTHKPPVLRSSVGGLWMVDANFKSSVEIRNLLEVAPLTVTPILYLSNGKPINLPPVKLDPSGTAVPRPRATRLDHVADEVMMCSRDICKP